MPNAFKEQQGSRVAGRMEKMQGELVKDEEM